MTNFILFCFLLLFLCSISHSILIPETRDLSFEEIPIDSPTSLGETVLSVSSVKEILPHINGFGLRSGGHFSFEISLQGNSLQDVEDAGVMLLALPQESWKYLKYAKYDQIAGYTYFFCDASSQYRYPFIDNTTWIHINETVLFMEQYAFLIVRCEQYAGIPPLKISIRNIEIVNPNNDHLAVEHQPYLFVYPVLFFCYFIFALYFIFTMLKNYRFVGMLHGVMLLMLICKVASLVMLSIVYQVSSYVGYVIPTFSISSNFVQVMSECAIILVLLVSAMGLTTSRKHLSIRETLMLFLIFVVYILCRSVDSSVCSTNSALDIFYDLFRFCGSFIVVYKILQFIYLFGILAALVLYNFFNDTLERLRYLITETNLLPHSQAEVYVKLRMIKSFRFGFLIILSFPIIIYFVEFALLSWKQEWMVTFFNELLILATVMLNLIIFRPRDLTEARPRIPTTPSSSTNNSSSPSNENTRQTEAAVRRRQNVLAMIQEEQQQ